MELDKLDSEVREAYALEFQALAESGRGVEIELDPIQAWMLVSTIQLALKHPENTGATALEMKKLAKELGLYLTEGYPTLTGLLAEVLS